MKVTDPNTPQELEGGAQDHEDFEQFGSYSNATGNNEQDYVFDDLLPQVRVESKPGVSVSLNQPTQNSNHGTLHVRIIHDNQMRVYLFRKDDKENGLTTFRVSFGLNVS